MALSDTPVYARTIAADLMALVDAYADTAYVNGIRSAWAAMARASIEGELIKMRVSEAEVRKQDTELIRQMRDALAYSTDPDHPHYEDQIAAIAAANARLEGT